MGLSGLAVGLVPAIWVLYNIVSAISSPIFGSLSDKVGRRAIIMASFIYYSVVYVLFGVSETVWSMWALFAAYGIYYGLSNGVFRAYIADLVDAEHRATAYGVFNTGIGLALAPASILFGVLWDAFGSQWAFFASAALSTVGFAIFVASVGLKAKPASTDS